MRNLVQKIKTKTMLRMFYVLLCLGLATSVTYSAYVTTLSGEDSATMATFTITSDITEAAAVTVPYDITTDGELYTYELVVQNYDDDTNAINNVDLDYSLTLACTGNLPLDITLRETTLSADSENGTDGDSGGNGTESTDETTTDTYVPKEGYGTVVQNTDGSYTISGAWLPHTEKVQHIYYIDVQWDEEAENYNDYLYAYEIDLITITIDAVQSMTSRASTEDVTND